MIDTQLILVDGIPGSGKSTTAQWIALELLKRNIAADWFMDEHRGNPVMAWDVPGNDQFIERILENWKQYSQAAQTSNKVMVLEGCLFQHIIQRLLAEDIERTQIRACIQTVSDTIHPLNPVLVYFYHTDVVLALQTIYAERGSEWAQYMIEGYNQSPYARASHTSGFDSLVKYYQEYRAFVDPLCKELGLNTLTIENSARDWSDHHVKILQFLSLPLITEEPLGLEYLTSFEGRYRDLSGTHPRDPECTIELAGDRLVICNFRYPRSSLIPKALQEFYVETLGYEVSFEMDKQGQASKMKVSGKEPGVGIGSATLLGREYHRI